ncbi:MAG: hypothetical protein ACLPVF_07240 [Acidimicrobiales bacterium]
MATLQLWCRVTLVGPDGTHWASGALEGPGDPDVGVVDDVAHLRLLAGRLGGRLVLAEVSPALRALLDLAGLGQVEWEAEGGEEAFGVQERQEERHPGDLAP